MQKLGQHFLKNPSAIKKIIDALEVGDGNIIFEVGPGNGVLTVPLAEKCAEKNAQVVAIEKDEKLADGLRSSADVARTGSVEIVSGDVLEILPALVLKSKNIKKFEYKLVGNIPYYITGHLLRIACELEPRPERCIFMVQKEVAERIVAAPPRMNRLAASVQVWGDPKIISRISKSSFIPPPSVDSAVIVIKTKTENVSVPVERYHAAMHALFAQPRKTILNNVCDGLRLMDGEQGNDKKNISEKLLEIGLDPSSRPQNLSIEDIASVARLLF